MELLIASDYRGYELKKKLLVALKKEGYEPTDLGCYDAKENDYNDSCGITNILINFYFICFIIANFFRSEARRIVPI